jgi:hypothetical protein
MVSSSSICCNDSLHSRSASDTYSSSSAEEVVADDGSESIPSLSEEPSVGSMKSLVDIDMAGNVWFLKSSNVSDYQPSTASASGRAWRKMELRVEKVVNWLCMPDIHPTPANELPLR